MFSILLFAGCQQELGDKIDFSVSMDENNSYVVGEPVTFNIDGNVDNILFFSGENGHNYDYRNRTSIEDLNLVNNANLTLDLQGRYGYRGWVDGVNDIDQLFIYVLKSGKTFQGLKGNDKEADAAMIASLEAEGGLNDWERIPYQDLEAYEQKWAPALTIDLKEHLDNFVLAFHWKPKSDKNKYRWWWFKGGMEIDIQGFDKTTKTLPQLGFSFYKKNVEDPYAVSNGTGPNGSIILGSATADIQFRGGEVKDHEPEVWAFSTPMTLNKVDKDTGVVIKNLQNYLPSYTYTFDEPGTYNVVFVGNNATVSGSSQQIIQKTVTIMDKPIVEG